MTFEWAKIGVTLQWHTFFFPMASDTTKTPRASNKKRVEPPNKRLNTELESSPDNSFSFTLDMEGILTEINEKLKKLDKLDSMSDDIKDLKETVIANGISLEQTRKDLESVKKKVKNVQRSVKDVTRENLKLKEKMLEMTARSMRDNLIFSGIPEKKNENVEDVLKTFFINELGINKEIVQKISFLRVHRLGPVRLKKSSYSNAVVEDQAKPRAIIACFEHYRYREMVFGLGPKLKGKSYGINQQYPVEIVDRRKALLPIFKEEKKNKKEKGRVKLVADKLYIDGEIYKDITITPWLFLLEPYDDDSLNECEQE